MDVEAIVKALHEQHPTIHREEKQSFKSERSGRPQPRRHNKNHGRQHPRKFKRHGYVADHQLISDSEVSDETEHEYERQRHRSQSAYAASSYDDRPTSYADETYYSEEADPYPGPSAEREYTAAEWAEYEFLGYHGGLEEEEWSDEEEVEPETVEELELQCVTACLDNGFTEE